MTPKYVTVSETIPLHRHTVEGLVDTIKEVFAGKEGMAGKPIRIVYNKNEPLVVDRRVRQELAGGLSLSAYQMIRQHTDIEIGTVYENPIKSLAYASQEFSNKEIKIICIVSNNKIDSYTWFDNVLRPEKILNTKFIEDPECPEGCLFLCGSKSGGSIKDIEYSILCRME